MLEVAARQHPHVLQYHTFFRGPFATMTTEAAAFPGPFAGFAASIVMQSPLRAAITAQTRANEGDCVVRLLATATLPSHTVVQAEVLARRLVTSLRAKGAHGAVEGLMREYALSSDEGVALMCLAEALLRIPDRATRDALIRDKTTKGDWQSHVGHSPSMFVNAATWGLLVTGKLVATNSEVGLAGALARLIARGGEPVVRKMWGEQPGKAFNPDYPAYFLKKVEQAQLFDNLGNTRSDYQLNETTHAVTVSLYFRGTSPAERLKKETKEKQRQQSGDPGPPQ